MNILHHAQPASWPRHMWRGALAALIAFELLCAIGVVRVSLQFTWLGLIITAAAGWAIVEAVGLGYRRQKGRPLPASIWAIVFFGLAMDASGDILQLYGRFLWWDRAVHVSVSAIACFTLFLVVNAFWIDGFRFAMLMRRGRMKLSLLLAAAGTMALGAVYEIEEYTEDRLFGTNRLGPGVDTADDLFLNLVGVAAAVAIILIHFVLTRKRHVVE